MNAGLTPAMACTSATRMEGFAASVSLGSWKRVSPYATKRSGVFTSSRKSTVDVCALDLPEQQVSASTVTATNNTATDCARGLRRKLMMEDVPSESESYFPTTSTSNCPFSAVERKRRCVFGSRAMVLAFGAVFTVSTKEYLSGRSG